VSGMRRMIGKVVRDLRGSGRVPELLVSSVVINVPD